MSKNDDATTKGVTDAWDFWLSQHPHSVPDLIEAAVTESVRRWLEDHHDDVMAAIRDGIRKGGH